MSHILTLQSHVVYGHAGNAAAVFPMQRLGHDVSILNLLQFSNHTGYGRWAGSVVSADELENILLGLDHVNALSHLELIISGYIGNLEQAKVIYQFITKLKEKNPSLLYCCDPVMGDVGRGLYVKPDIAHFIQSHLSKLANWITPNIFELAYLSKKDIFSHQDALIACQHLLREYPLLQGVLATSISETKETTGLLLVTPGMAYHCETPKYALIDTVHGTGDVATAIYMSHLLKGDGAMMAMQKTANTLHDITQYTHDHHLRELGIIASQNAIAHPRDCFKAKAISFEFI